MKICDRVKTTAEHDRLLRTCKQFEGVITEIDKVKDGYNATVLDTNGEEQYIDTTWIEKVQFFTDEDIIEVIKNHTYDSPVRERGKFSELNRLLEGLVRTLQTKFNDMVPGYEEIGITLKAFRKISDEAFRIEHKLPRGRK